MYLNCSAFSLEDDKYVAHYYFSQDREKLAHEIEHETNLTVIPQILVNRSQSNENYFQTVFGKELEFLRVEN